MMAVSAMSSASYKFKHCAGTEVTDEANFLPPCCLESAGEYNKKAGKLCGCGEKHKVGLWNQMHLRLILCSALGAEVGQGI